MTDPRRTRPDESVGKERVASTSPHTVIGMCPHCGEDVEVVNTLTVTHDWPKPTRQVCPGSGQYPRCAESDARPLWSGEPNRRFRG